MYNNQNRKPPFPKKGFSKGRKPFGFKRPPSPDKILFNKEYQEFLRNHWELIQNLSDDIKDIEMAVDTSLEGDKEPDFLYENKDKSVTLLMRYGNNKTGLLKDISSYGVILKEENHLTFIYKHAIAGYCLT